MQDTVSGDVPPHGRADAVVVAFLSSDVIGDCLRSLRADPAIDRIVVVDNSPEAATKALVADVASAGYIASPDNVGFGRGVNSARAYVSAEYIVLANPDTTQSDLTVTKAIRFLHERPRAAIVGPRMVFPDGRLYRNSQHALGLVRMTAERLQWPDRLRVSRTAAEHQTAHTTDYVIGSFVVLRREALDAVGWFDERIFLFGEDQDLCRRLRRAGWEVWYAPLGRVVHASGHSWRQLSDGGRAAFQRARERELMAEGGRRTAFVYSSLAKLRLLRHR